MDDCARISSDLLILDSLQVNPSKWACILCIESLMHNTSQFNQPGKTGVYDERKINAFLIEVNEGIWESAESAERELDVASRSTEKKIHPVA